MAKTKGGARPGAGRKPNPAKQLGTDAATAERILKELGYEKEIVSLYKSCGDVRIKVQILTALENRAYGRPTQNIRYMHDEDNPIEVRLTLSEAIQKARKRAGL